MPDPIDDLDNIVIIPPSNSSENEPNPLFEGIDEADLPIVQKYAEKFQPYYQSHQELDSYKQLGDLESIQNALNVVAMADANPVEFYKYIKTTLTDMGLLEVDPINDPTNETSGNPPVSGLPEFEGLPPAFIERYSSVEKTLEGINQFIQNYNATQEQQMQEQQLDNLLQKLQDTHGNFDQAAVLGRMLNGMEPEEAIKDWKKALESYGVVTPKTPPPTLSNGGIPNSGVDFNKILNDKKSRVALVKDLLDQANNS